jgi:succinate dehydrogenase/fumarate reductase cytochrome b subunit
MSDEDDRGRPREVRNPSARTGNVVHWVTHARRRGLGMWAWLLHRVTAVMILGIGILHVLKNQFGVLVPGGRLVTIDLLIFPGVYHALNGVRVILVEAFDWAAVNEDRLFIGVLALTFLFIFYWTAVVGL